MGQFDREALYEAKKIKNRIELSKTVSVNYDLSTDDENNRIFKTVDNAISWINLHGGVLSESNTWTIKLPSGIITEPLIKLEFINFESSAGTIINKLTSGVVYNTSADLSKAGIGNVQIGTIIIPTGMCLSLQNCSNNYIEIGDNTSRLFAIGGFFNTLDLGNAECNFDNSRIRGVISNFNQTTFSNCTLQNEITIASGETLTFVNSVCTSITNNGTLNNYQPTYDSDVIASETKKGCTRYTEGSGYSRYQMVMKTGTDTWEWVTIKENTW